jgi:ABC-2 type transport system permease protein
MAIWTLAKKETRLLLRDRLAAVILLGMPLLFILILGVLLGESDQKLRITLVDLDAGKGLDGKESWAKIVQRDLAETGGVKVEVLENEDEAKDLIHFHKRAAVVIFKTSFSDQVNKCSFLADGINPFYRDGVELGKVHVEILSDSMQPGTSAVIEQVVQVTLLRVLMPRMIGLAFEKLSEERFIQKLGDKVRLPVPSIQVPVLPGVNLAETMFETQKIKLQKPYLLTEKALDMLRAAKIPEVVLSKLAPLAATEKELEKENEKEFETEAAFKEELARILTREERDQFQNRIVAAARLQPRASLNDALRVAAHDDAGALKKYRAKVGLGVQAALREQFSKYNLTGMTWAALTKAQDTGSGKTVEDAPPGLLNRGAQRYQMLVPAYTVMFAFFLVMNVGWIFVDERRQGTLKRLRAAPVTRAQILLGKLIPYLFLSVGQGLFLLAAGRLIFGMRWGPASWSLGEQILALLPVVLSTSLAAMALAMLVAAVARTEIQVTLYGAVPALLLALIGGCVLPREMMSEQAQRISFLTPQGWALDAYRELLFADPTYAPNMTIVARACAVLVGFAAVFLGLAWKLLRLE